MNELILQTKHLKDLLGQEFKLSIPDYQRAYEWKSYHVKNLLNDTYHVGKKDKSYLIGTIILHKHDVNNDIKYDIVDGQQRLITLSIILHCLGMAELPLLNAVFDNIKSFFYIKNTQNEANAFLKNKHDKESYKNYLLEQLEFSVLIISGDNAIDLAYTFFDSGNSKGKTLSDFDLLKAHHLMYIPEELEQLARKHNDFWHNYNDKHHQLFSSTLRRLRMWSRGLDRDNNSDRNDYYEFISTVEPNEIEQNEHLFNRYMQPNVFRSWHRENDEVVLNMKYPQNLTEALIPFEIPQTIEGGDSFFLYAKRYHEMFEHLFGGNDENKSSFINYVYRLSKSIENDYLATVYKAVLLLYYDKFGENRIIEAASCTELIISEIRFRWGNARPSPLRIETTLSKVKDTGIIPIILNSTISSHVIALLINQVSLHVRDPKESPTLNNYKKRITMFYNTNKSKLKNKHILEKINYLY